MTSHVLVVNIYYFFHLWHCIMIYIYNYINIYNYIYIYIYILYIIDKYHEYLILIIYNRKYEYTGIL